MYTNQSFLQLRKDSSLLPLAGRALWKLVLKHSFQQVCLLVYKKTGTCKMEWLAFNTQPCIEIKCQLHFSSEKAGSALVPFAITSNGNFETEKTKKKLSMHSANKNHFYRLFIVKSLVLHIEIIHKWAQYLLLHNTHFCYLMNHSKDLQTDPFCSLHAWSKENIWAAGILPYI